MNIKEQDTFIAEQVVNYYPIRKRQLPSEILLEIMIFEAETGYF
jgi:hypothetical protein